MRVYHREYDFGEMSRYMVPLSSTNSIHLCFWMLKPILMCIEIAYSMRFKVD